LTDSSPRGLSMPPADTEPPTRSALSPVGALRSAFSDTLRLLFGPFDTRRWIKLSVVCLFLGGGTASAAFHWSLSTLPADLGYEEARAFLREYLIEHPGLILLAVVLAISLALIILYLRALFRFVLVDCLVRGDVLLQQDPQVRPLMHSYFFWLLGALLAMGVALGAGTLAAFPHLLSAAGPEAHSVSFWMTLAGLLLMEVVIGLSAAVIIALTDDLVVPTMYAERLRLLPAWRKVAQIMHCEAGSVVLFVLLRFVVSVGIGVAVLMFLFPALVALFSGGVIVGVLVILALRLVGFAWVWNPLTLLLTALALLVLMSLMLILLAVAGMPGQVFLQGFGIRFIAPRVPSLQTRWHASHPPGQSP
jgi:hypothetical protein